MVTGMVVQQSGCGFSEVPSASPIGHAKQIEQGSCLSPANAVVLSITEQKMKLIELSSGCNRLDSVVEANEKGDKKALVAALEANIATIDSILTAAQSVKDRYTPTLLDLIWDLEKAHKLRDGQTNDRA